MNAGTRGTVPLHDVIVVGAGPNGLSCAVELARAGLSVLVVEAASEPGGGARTEALTLPGFLHDPCSTVHPLAVSSPFFRSLHLERFGLRWVHAPCPLAHVVDEDRVVRLERDLAATVVGLGADGPDYARLVEPVVRDFEILMEMFLGPLRFPSHPVPWARFGLTALRSLKGLSRWRWEDASSPAAALMAGIGAHAMLPLDRAGTAAFALVLAASAHAVGWPLARGGSGAITRALVACLEESGGELRLGLRVNDVNALPPARAYVLDLTPREIMRITGGRLPPAYRAQLGRYRYGPGVCKVDWALSGPVPWTQPSLRDVCTIHLSGVFADVDAAEASVHAGELASKPFILFVQPSLFDDIRAPPGKHTAWAYCHVPSGSPDDASSLIESEVERFAPGFRASILGRSVRTAVQMEAINPNYVGGDINGGLADLGQLFFRPVPRLDPYSTPAPDVFICSSATPPGGGVHGLCGYFAAESVLRRAFGGRRVGRQLNAWSPRYA